MIKVSIGFQEMSSKTVTGVWTVAGFFIPANFLALIKILWIERPVRGLSGNLPANSHSFGRY